MIWRYAYFEEQVCLFMLHYLQEGMCFVDIGAHFGFFTLFGNYLVGKKGRVFSFEPTPSAYQQLFRNVANCPNVQTHNCAAFSEESEMKFCDYGLEKSAHNSVFGTRIKDHSLNAPKALLVRARTVDNVIKEEGCREVHFVKIHAESSEIHVLRGMTEILKAYRPYVVIEVGDFGIDGVPTSEEIVTWLQEMGYIPYEVRNGECVRHSKKTYYEYGNLLFIPDI